MDCFQDWAVFFPVLSGTEYTPQTVLLPPLCHIPMHKQGTHHGGTVTSSQSPQNCPLIVSSGAVLPWSIVVDGWHKCRIVHYPKSTEFTKGLFDQGVRQITKMGDPSWITHCHQLTDSMVALKVSFAWKSRIRISWRPWMQYQHSCFHHPMNQHTNEVLEEWQAFWLYGVKDIGVRDVVTRKKVISLGQDLVLSVQFIGQLRLTEWRG